MKLKNNIDLRSDTVTKPSIQMKAYMMDASYELY